jgi:hypothetical protein
MNRHTTDPRPSDDEWAFQSEVIRPRMSPWVEQTDQASSRRLSINARNVRPTCVRWGRE